MRFLSARSNSKADEENPYWISFSDIMSGLLIIFVLAVLALILELTQTKTEVSEAIKELAKAEQIRREILDEIARELYKKNIEVKIVDNHTVLRIPDELLSFETNRFEIPENETVKRTVLEIGRTLYDAITLLNRWQYLDTIFIEGHTDERRYKGSKYKFGNWELSTLRAISLSQIMQFSYSRKRFYLNNSVVSFDPCSQFVHPKGEVLSSIIPDCTDQRSCMNNQQLFCK